MMQGMVRTGIRYRKENEMRKSNWKIKLLIILAVLVGIAAALAAALIVYAKYPNATGLTFFGTLALAAGGVIVLGVKIFHIGED